MIKIQAESNVPTEYGQFRMIAFLKTKMTGCPHMAIVANNTDLSQTVNVRFHSECITGEVFHSGSVNADSSWMLQCDTPMSTVV